MKDKTFIVQVIEKYFFKVRNLIKYFPQPDDTHDVGVVRLDGIEEAFIAGITDKKLHDYLRRREKDPSWVLFFCKQDNCLMGYAFLHIPTEIEWNDSLPTLAYEARVSNQFVYPEYRGRGVVNTILCAQAQYAEKENRVLWAVIEKSNLSSMRAGLRAGRVVRKNYLVKLVGRNVISMLTNPLKIYFLTGWRRAKR